MIDLINCLCLVFFSYLIKDADILLKPRLTAKTYLAKFQFSGGAKQFFAAKSAYWLQCHICQSFWLSLVLAISETFPGYAPLAYPMAVAILYKNIK